jgi:hypothetical protein
VFGSCYFWGGVSVAGGVSQKNKRQVLGDGMHPMSASTIGTIGWLVRVSEGLERQKKRFVFGRTQQNNLVM